MIRTSSTLILWDIDGTLLKGSQAATAAFNQALRDVYELGVEPVRVEYGGKTDNQIALEVLALHDILEAQALDGLGRFHEHYIGLVEERFDVLQESIRVLPGVWAIIDALQAEGAIQSLLTGNLRATAELKLRAVGLEERLDLEVGAYGSDHRNRNELVPIARGKAEARYGPLREIVVIGDTPRDIACGKAGYARTVAVATGTWSVEQLAEHQPDALLPDLSDLTSALAAILGAAETKG
jgi:phosphoglycolate phosphatase-like HAD superfamily hydrolase